jgi:hypothetical protein
MLSQVNLRVNHRQLTFDTFPKPPEIISNVLRISRSALPTNNEAIRSGNAMNRTIKIINRGAA